MNKFLLASSGEQFNMVSSWEDELYCSILKDGTISLRASKNGEDEYGGRWWFKAKRGIKTPKQFIDEFNRIDEIEVGNWSVETEILPVLYDHYPLFASLTSRYLEIDEFFNQPELDFFMFSQKYILRVDVSLPNEFESGIKIVKVIYNFVKEQFKKSGNFPSGTHELMGLPVLFPLKVGISKKDFNLFKKEQILKNHAHNSSWVMPRTKLQGFNKENQYQKIIQFCRNYLEENNQLPYGEHLVDNIEVEFKK